MEEEYREVEEKNPFFNMAKKTLEGLDLIKNHMLLNDLYSRENPERQQVSIELLKKFYMFAIPLFPPDDKSLDAMETEILTLKMETRIRIKSGIQEVKPVYSKEVEDKINKLFIKMSKLLKPYLMPIKRDDDGL